MGIVAKLLMAIGVYYVISTFVANIFTSISGMLLVPIDAMVWFLTMIGTSFEMMVVFIVVGFVWIVVKLFHYFMQLI